MANTRVKTGPLAADEFTEQVDGEVGLRRYGRGKLVQRFVTELALDFERNGRKVIWALREKNPVEYCKIIAALVPKDINLNISADQELGSLPDHILRSMLSDSLSKLQQQGVSTGYVIDAQRVPLPSASTHMVLADAAAEQPDPECTDT